MAVDSPPAAISKANLLFLANGCAVATTQPKGTTTSMARPQSPKTRKGIAASITAKANRSRSATNLLSGGDIKATAPSRRIGQRTDQDHMYRILVYSTGPLNLRSDGW